MKNIKLKITGIKDNISKEKLINKLKEKKGIKNVEFNIPEKILSITYNKINKTKIEDYLDDLDTILGLFSPEEFILYSRIRISDKLDLRYPDKHDIEYNYEHDFSPLYLIEDIYRKIEKGSE